MRDLIVDFEHHSIMMTAAFAKKCADPSSSEYRRLQEVRLENPNYTVKAHRIKKNTKKESYKGLTYAYMEDYIRRHEEGEKQIEILTEYSELRLIAECHSTGHRYPAIKKWFLAKYPEVSSFEIPKEYGEEQEEKQNSLEIVEPAKEQESTENKDLSNAS